MANKLLTGAPSSNVDGLPTKAAAANDKRRAAESANRVVDAAAATMTDKFFEAFAGQLSARIESPAAHTEAAALWS